MKAVAYFVFYWLCLFTWRHIVCHISFKKNIHNFCFFTATYCLRISVTKHSHFRLRMVI